ncbi:MAG TPA: LuxR C-terminal-related transcriptional regulator [Acidimicrobiales bacterium]|jgi:DNA-binding CsgD family transcriptional regulator|nr:LuxR C-terminal-related transcriptional regulator [Acidimicrobiales bacterium]
MVLSLAEDLAPSPGEDRGQGASPVRPQAARALLTPGELDAALRAATGRSNKQIASAMYLSVRTVENRLQRVYEKLGASGRHELLEVLGARVTVDLVA